LSPLAQRVAFRLDGKRALVTGAGRGIGLGAANALAAAGANVVLLARSIEQIEAAAAAIREAGGAAEAIAIDVTETDATLRLIAAEGPFDILVNNAGTNHPAPLLDVTPADFDTIFAPNVRAAFFVAQAVARGLRQAGKAGSIINISSQMGHVGSANRSVYCASKHAMEGFTKAMAIELGPYGIRVNTICPTFVETELTAGYFADPAFRAAVVAKIKTGRLASVDDVVGAIVFLASDAAAMITGAPLLIDGGWTAE
jgi:NAD(P)-dependent dehydrogenase (short-subunit alcohol dehydrogenase family)